MYVYILIVSNNLLVYRKEFKTRDRSLEYLSGIVTDLFVDWNRLQGLDVKHRIPQVQQAILTGVFDQILSAFLTSSKR